MLGRTHALTGLAAGLAVAAVTGTVSEVPIAAYGLAAAGALLPDLDQRQALANRMVVTRPANWILRHLRHRQFTHSFAGLGLFTLFCAIIFLSAESLFGKLPLGWFWAAPVGWASHIVADMFNKQGVGLFAPFGRGRLEWIAVPLPRALRISTIYDPQGAPITLGRIQARIHTERLFFRWPIYGLIFLVLWHHAEAMVSVARTDVWHTVVQLPGPLRSLLETLLR